MQTIRVFISSPSDVAAERAAALRVIERLKRQYHGRARLDPFLWEHDAYEASRPFHAQIPRAGEYDVVILIMWSKLGTPLTVDGREYASGTVFEFEDALCSATAGRTRLLVYRKTTPLPLNLSHTREELLQAKVKFDEVEKFFHDNFDHHQGGVRGFNSFDATAAFEDGLEKELRKQIDSSRAATREVSVSEESPYRGLQLFDEEHQHFFCGRTRAVYHVVGALQHQAAAGRPFIVVFGRSGVGKSSFIRAGVAPYLTGANVIAGVSCWRRALFEPSDSTTNLVGGLASAICADGALPEAAEGAGGRDAFARLLRENTDAAVILIRQCLREVARTDNAAEGAAARLLVLIDPLEEMFTRGIKAVRQASESGRAPTHDQEIREFAKVLHNLCTSGVVWIVASLRNDFHDQASAIPDLQALQEGEGQYHLAPLSPSEIAQAVMLPAEIAGVRFEETADRGSLATEIVDAALHHTDPLPLLSYTLDQLFERSYAATTGYMTFAAFDQLGGVDGALSRRADEALSAARARMTGKASDCWDKVFGLLVDVDRDGRRVRVYARSAQFDDPDSRALREELDRARLLITDIDDQHRPVVSIAHETMLTRWTTLRDWIDERAEQLRLRSMLAGLTQDWSPNRDPEFLVLQGARLARAEQFIHEPRGLEIDPVVREFVQANADRRDEADRRAKARWRNAFMVISAACVAALVACGVALYQKGELRREKNATETVSEDLQDVLKFMLTLIQDRLNTRAESDRQLISAIGKRVAEHYTQIDVSQKSPAKLVDASTQMANDARMLADIRLFEAATPVMERSIQVYEASELADPIELAHRWDDLGDWYFRRSMFDEEEAAYKTSLKVRADAGLGDSPENQHALAGLGMLLKTKGEYAQAVIQLRRCIKALEAANPPMEQELADQYDALADILRNLTWFDECEEVSKRGIELAEKVAKEAPANDPRQAAVLKYRSEFAVVRQRQKRLPEAKAMLLDVKKKYHDDIGVDQDYARILYKLARVQIDLKEYDDAKAALDESYDLLKSRPGELPMAKCLEARAQLHFALKEYSDAEDDIREALEIRSAKLSGPNPDLFDARLLLADALEAQGKTNDALHERDQAVKLQNEFQRQINSRPTQAKAK